MKKEVVKLSHLGEEKTHLKGIIIKFLETLAQKYSLNPRPTSGNFLSYLTSRPKEAPKVLEILLSVLQCPPDEKAGLRKALKAAGKKRGLWGKLF